MNSAILEQVIELAVAAGRAIMAVYLSDKLDVATKDDDSPITAADLAAHQILAPGLAALLDGVPVLSEESAIPDFEARRQWQKYWIIDPLDGTKEFIGRNGEFTVNIALVEAHAPTLGVVHVPVTGATYAGVAGGGAFLREANGKQTSIGVRAMAGRGGTAAPVVVVASRRHGADAVDQLLNSLASRLGVVETSNMGSSLKLCLVAEGKADIYPRLAPTMEWDTAAAQGVVEAAGGVVLTADLDVMRYNTKADLLNPYFYVLGDSSYAWRELLTQQKK